MTVASEESARSAGIFWTIILLFFVAPILSLTFYGVFSRRGSTDAFYWIFVGLLGLFMAAILRDMVRGTIEYARYGRSYVQLDGAPGLGKRLAGVLELSGKAAGARVEFQLRYVQALEPRTRSTSGMEQRVWNEQRNGIADAGARLPFEFMIPADLPAPLPGTRWELAARVQIQNSHFTRHFRMPADAAQLHLAYPHTSYDRT